MICPSMILTQEQDPHCAPSQHPPARGQLSNARQLIDWQGWQFRLRFDARQGTQRAQPRRPPKVNGFRPGRL